MIYTNLGFDMGVYEPEENDVCQHNDWERTHLNKSGVLQQCGDSAVVRLIITFGGRPTISTALCDAHLKATIQKLEAR